MKKFLIYLRQIALLPNHHQRRIHFGTALTVWVLKKMRQKFLVTFFLYIFHVKTK